MMFDIKELITFFFWVGLAAGLAGGAFVGVLIGYFLGRKRW